MYETEANSRSESLEQIPDRIQQRFRELRKTIRARTALPWGEHCTECVWPTCYTSCDLYTPREDRRCRRFVDGMVRIDCPGSVNSYVLKIGFKRWGKLWTPGNLRLYSLPEAVRREAWDYRVGTAVHGLRIFGAAGTLIANKRFALKNTLAQRRRPSDLVPTSFVVECYNPGDRAISLSLTMRPVGDNAKVPFQTLINVPPGFVRARIRLDEISEPLWSAPFHVELVPNDIADGTTLYFGVMDFVQELEPSVVREHQWPKVKCIVWDLDNTVWDGVLTEDGPDRLALKAGISDVIKELDRRGILQSVASKNDYDRARSVLDRFGLAEFFLYPQISWGAKNIAVETIARKLNIGRDTVLFVDDSEFELEQVRSACPDVRVVNAAAALTLLDRSDCQVEVTTEASNRRQLYRQAVDRDQASATFGADYLSFLRSCDLELTVNSLTPANLQRVHELTQRTNQMNFSGTRYDHDVLGRLLTVPHLDTFVLECRDRFGSYGVIGFSIVDRREPRLTDLMFSCRIQSKRVEHAFLHYLFGRYMDAPGRDFWANYRKTTRNAPSGQVFADLGMGEVSVTDGVTSLVLRHGSAVKSDGVVRIIDRVGAEPAYI